MTQIFKQKNYTPKGRLTTQTMLGPQTWFNVGGEADFIFKPTDTQDLSEFCKNILPEIPLTPLGAGSNIILSDQGIEGIVLKFSGHFSKIEITPSAHKDEFDIIVGAAALDQTFAKTLLKHSIAGLEFFIGIPGTIGGALRMNAGAYGTEIKDILISAETVHKRTGEIKTFSKEELDFSYRKCGLNQDYIFTSAHFKAHKGNPDLIKEKMDKITNDRELTQPTKSKTGGSTFKNPNGYKAWKLIDQAGCRGLQIGSAQISEKHCNFMINLGDATASDLITLGETVIKKVAASSGIHLEWEIKHLGRFDK